MLFDSKLALNAGKKSKRSTAKKEESMIKQKLELLN